MAENELEVRLDKKINGLQQQVSSLGVYIKRVHGQVTHPSVLSRIKEREKDSLSAFVSITDVFNFIYPVGRRIIEVTGVNPGITYGMGTWTLVSQGRMVVGYKAGDADFGTVKGVGGAKTATPDAHAGGAVTRGAAGITVDNHADHVHSGSADHTSVATKQGTAAGNVVTTATHGNTGNPTAALTHTVTEPNAGAGHDHAFTQPSAHAAMDILNPYEVVYIWERTV